MSRRMRLFLIVVPFVILALSQMACTSAEYVPPSQQGDLTIEQKNALLKVVKFSMDGDVPEGQEAALFLDLGGEAAPIVVGRLRDDGKLSISLDAEQRSGVSLRIREADTENAWSNVYSFGTIKQGSEFRIRIDVDLTVKVGVTNNGG